MKRVFDWECECGTGAAACGGGQARHHPRSHSCELMGAGGQVRVRSESGASMVLTQEGEENARKVQEQERRGGRGESEERPTERTT
eukprot:661386-Rhodomonas_salina.1